MKITVLQSKNNIPLAKTFKKDKVESYGNAKWFKHSDYDISSINELSELLSILEELTDHVVIRGELKNTLDIDIEKDFVRRACRDKAITGEEAFYNENKKGVEWIMLDFDGIPADEFIQGVSHEYKVEYLVNLLPNDFHNVSYHYQWSNSAGINGWDTLSCHVWMWLDEPRTDTQMMTWGKSIDCIDESVFRTVQCNYTANPIFDGVNDPLSGNRSGLVIKDKNSVYIPIPPVQTNWYQARFVQNPVGGITDNYNPKFEDKLAEISMGRRHSPIRDAVASWIVNTGYPSDYGKLKQRIRDRIMANPRSDKDFHMSDSYLDQQIESAEQKFRSKNPNLPPHMPETKLEKLQYELIAKKGFTYEEDE